MKSAGRGTGRPPPGRRGPAPDGQRTRPDRRGTGSDRRGTGSDGRGTGSDGRGPAPDRRGPAYRRDPDRRPKPEADGEIIYGKHSVRAVFRARPGAIRRVILREGAARYLQEFIDLAREAGVEPELTRSGEFLRLGGLDADDKHQGLFVVTDPLTVCTEYDFDLLGDAAVVIVLDQLSNPQNFGTIIRTAAFYGVDGIIWLKNRAVDIDATVTRIAVGGTEMVRLFRVTNLARAIDLLKERGFWVYGLDERGDKTLAQTTFDAKSVLVIGAEGEGMRHRTKLYCDEMLQIPGGQPGLGSLNAAVAAGIVIAEVFRSSPAQRALP
jgi:23S rRNA (guanosine2251-2'-O)-methyltransferase